MTRLLAFLSIYFLVYGGMHFYLFLKIRKGLVLGKGESLSLLLFLLLMVIAPITVRQLEGTDLQTMVTPLAFTAFLWMGAAFLFFSASLLLDIYHAVLALVGRFSIDRPVAWRLSPATRVWVAAGFALSATLYGLFEADDIRLETVSITSQKVPQSAGTVRLVQLTDVHLGALVGERKLAKIMKMVKSLNPDMLISTGDLLDSSTDNVTGLAAGFAGLNPRLGMYAVNGNHEFFGGVDKAIKFMTEAGFTVLRGETVSIDDWLTIAGVDDLHAGWSNGVVKIDEVTVLSNTPADHFRVLLKHQPRVMDDAIGLFDLQISGHVHQGQIFPFRLLQYLVYPVSMGLSPLGKGSRLYISRGTGTWGPPIRFLAPPEITLFEISAATAN